MKLIYLADLDKYIEPESKYPRPLNTATAILKLTRHGMSDAEAFRYLSVIRNSPITYKQFFGRDQVPSPDPAYIGQHMFVVNGKKRKVTMLLNDLLQQGLTLSHALELLKNAVDESGKD